jgi:hypothetical protein
MKILLLILALNILIFINSVHKTKIEKCKNLKLNFDFKKEKFFGRWYPIVVSKNFPLKPDCFAVDINDLSRDQIMGASFDRKQNRTLTTHVMTSKTANSFVVKKGNIQGLISILDTDYNSYAVVYACVEQLYRRYVVAILSRNETLPEDKLKNLTNFVREKTGIKNYKNVIQANSTCLQ